MGKGNKTVDCVWKIVVLGALQCSILCIFLLIQHKKAKTSYQLTRVYWLQWGDNHIRRYFCSIYISKSLYLNRHIIFWRIQDGQFGAVGTYTTYFRFTSMLKALSYTNKGLFGCLWKWQWRKPHCRFKKT